MSHYTNDRLIDSEPDKNVLQHEFNDHLTKSLPDDIRDNIITFVTSNELSIELSINEV